MIYVLALLVAFLPPPKMTRAITVVFVEPPGEQFTGTMQAQAYADTAQALAWWEALSPTPTTLRITATRTMTVTSDVYATLPYFSGDLTIVIIDNQQSARLLDDRARGLANPSAGMVWVVHGTGGISLQADIAHELGHAVYGLPDRYQTPGACVAMDIMCFRHDQAYAAHWIGCGSLADLGAPCRATYLPIAGGA